MSISSSIINSNLNCIEKSKCIKYNENDIYSAYELKELFSSEELTIVNIKNINLQNINTTINELGSSPLHWLCINTKITAEIIEYVKLNSNADFDKYTEICCDNKIIKISPLSALCQNPSLTLKMLICLRDCKFAPNNYEKHKVCSPIFTLCTNPNISIFMISFVHSLGYDLYQYSTIIDGETSFDKLFENSAISYEIVKFMFDNYELKLLFTKSPIIKLFSNPAIDLTIVNFFNDNYKRILEENFSTILKNPKIICMNLNLEC